MAVGRGDELGQLRGALQRGSLVVVSGGVGMGKTTLVQALEADMGRLLTGQSLPCTAQRTYQPILNALSWAPVSVEPPLMADRVREELGAADTLVLEDVQWADEGTLAVLVGLAGHCGVVLTVEPSSSTAQRVRRLGHSLGAEFIDLRPLGPSESRELVDELRPDLMIGERQRLADASGGNPMVARLLANSFDHGLVPRGDDRALVSAILRRCSEPASATLAMLSMAPGPLPLEQLGEIEELEGAGLVTEEPDGFIAPTHRLFADCALESMGTDDRRELAAVLADMPGIPRRQRAEYLLEAGRAREALVLATQCRADPVPSAEQAAVLLTAARASKQLRDDPVMVDSAELIDDGAHDRLLVRAAGALNDTGRFRDAAELLGDLNSIEDRSRAAAAVEMLRSSIGCGDRSTALEVARSIAPLMGGDDGVHAARARSMSAMVFGWSEDRSPAGTEQVGCDSVELDSNAVMRSLARAQLAVARGGAERSHASLLVGLASYSDGVDVATEWFRIAREEARGIGEVVAELESARNLVMVQISLGQHEEGRSLAHRSRALAETHGEPAWVIEFRTLDVLSRFYDGADHDEALTWLSFVRTAPVRLETRALATAVLATLLADRREIERSGEVLRDWIVPSALEGFEPMIQAVLLWGATQRAWILGDTAEAVRLARWATDLVPAGYPTLAGTQVVWRWAQYEAGMELTAPDPTGGLLDCAELEADAIRALAEGDAEVAADGFLAAAESWRPILRRCALRSLWGAGRALTAAGRPDRAVEILEGVEAELDGAGCAALRPRVVSALREADGRGTTGTRGSRSGERITLQERAVMSLAAEGLRTAEIARRLGIAPATVQSHVRSAKQKLGARSRAEAVGLMRAGSVD